jgi:uncharacterized membrane protein
MPTIASPNFYRTVRLHPRRVNSLERFAVCLTLSGSDKVRGHGWFEKMTMACPHCAAQMPDTAGFCPGCGRTMRPTTRAQGMVGVLPQTLAGALAYFLLPSFVFLLVEPYKKNRFVRFHSFQCFGVCLTAIVTGAALRLAGIALFFIPVLGHLLVWLFSMVVSLAFLTVWMVLIVKALQGEMYKLPLVGDFAERQAAGG